MSDWIAMLVDLPYGPAVLVKVTVLLAAAWLAHGLLRGRNPRWRVLLWRGVLVAVVALPLAEWALPRLEVAILEQPAAPRPEAFVAADLDPISFNAISPPDVPIASADPRPAPAPPPFDLRAWATEHVVILLCAAWCVIALVLLVRMGRGWLRVCRTIAQSQPAPVAVRALADTIACDFGMSYSKVEAASRRFNAAGRRVHLDVRVVEELGSPFLTGIRRPIIVLPARCLQESDPSQLRAILAHELAHVKSRDPFWLAFGRVAASLFWFHPLMWRVTSAHSAACEEVCDGVAANYLGSAESYSKALAREALALHTAHPAPGGVPMLRTAEIVRRLQKIQRGIRVYPVAKRSLTISSVTGAALLLALFSIEFVQAQPELAELLRGYTTCSDWLSRSDVRIVSTSANIGFNEGPTEYDFIQRRNDPQFASSYQQYLIDEAGNRQSLQSGEVEIFDGKYRHHASKSWTDEYYKGFINQPPDPESMALLQSSFPPNGGFLDGYLDGMGGHPLSEILAQAEQAGKVTVSSVPESIDGVRCYKVEGKSPYGSVKVWLAPERGGNALRYSIIKTGQDLYASQAVADMGIEEWEVTVDDITLTQFDGRWICTGGHFGKSVRLQDGNVTGATISAQRTNVELNPDFSALNAFSPAAQFPDGTVLMDATAPGGLFSVQGGTIVPVVGDAGASSEEVASTMAEYGFQLPPDTEVVNAQTGASAVATRSPSPAGARVVGGANAEIATEQLIASYRDKKRALATYRIQYTEDRKSFDAAGALKKETRWVHEYLSKESHAAVHSSVIDVPTRRVRRTISHVQNPTEEARLWYSNGVPSKAQIDPARGDANIVTQGAHTPVAYAGLLGANIPDAVVASQGSSRDVATFLRASNTQLADAHEKVGEYQCVVAENRGETGEISVRQWLAPELDFALCKMELYSSSAEESPVVRMRVTSTEFQPAAPGLQIPHVVKVQSYFPEYDYALGYEAVYTVTSLENNVPLEDKLFEIEIPAGVTVVDNR